MRPCREIAFLVALLPVTLLPVTLLLAAPFTGAASAQETAPAKTPKASKEFMKATAPEKMMRAGEARKMRECDERAQRQKIKMEDRAGFVDRCVAGEVK